MLGISEDGICCDDEEPWPRRGCPEGALGRDLVIALRGKRKTERGRGRETGRELRLGWKEVCGVWFKDPLLETPQIFDKLLFCSSNSRESRKKTAKGPRGGSGH